MQWFRPNEVAVMNALTTAVLSLGIALSVTTAAPLAKIMDWQMALTVFALPGVLGLAAWLVLGRESGGVPMPGGGLSLREVGMVLRNRTVVLLRRDPHAHALLGARRTAYRGGSQEARR